MVVPSRAERLIRAAEEWAEKNWTGDDYAAACAAWMHTTGHAADPVHAWAVTGPIDRAQQARDTAGDHARPARDRAGAARRRAAPRQRDNGADARPLPPARPFTLVHDRLKATGPHHDGFQSSPFTL